MFHQIHHQRVLREIWRLVQNFLLRSSWDRHAGVNKPMGPGPCSHPTHPTPWALVILMKPSGRATLANKMELLMGSDSHKLSRCPCSSCKNGTENCFEAVHPIQSSCFKAAVPFWVTQPVPLKVQMAWVLQPCALIAGRKDVA